MMMKISADLILFGTLLLVFRLIHVEARRRRNERHRAMRRRIRYYVRDI